MLHLKAVVRLALGTVILSGMVEAQSVKITPLGARTGEFCSPDRALVLEDPTGVRLLYDPANTVAGSTDGRLENIHAVLVSHAHSDHLGNGTMIQSPDDPNASCASITSTPVSNSNAAEIAVSKKAAFIGASDLTTFVASKMQLVANANIPGCQAVGLTNETTVPAMNGPCSAGVGFGAKRTLKVANASAGVQIAVVVALHGNAVGNNFVSDPLGPQLSSNGLALAPGSASGYILKFTNGLTVYLSGDTGLTSDMLLVVKAYYHPDLVVMNIGDIFTTGPEEAAFAINEFVRPRSVIPSHANEVATASGAIVPGTKTARFSQLVERAAVLAPLSGITMEFDGNGNCTAGCNGKPARRRW
jgi:L-ascorbate metabolism protein UlaG (beta-lactamase superfamily)